MQVSVRNESITAVAADGIVVNLFEGVAQPGGATGAVNQALGGMISQLIADGDFKGKLGEVQVFRGNGVAATRVALVGLGPSGKFTLDAVRTASAEAAKALRARGAAKIATIVHGAGIGGLDARQAAAATIEGALLGLYRFGRYQTGNEDTNDIAEIIVAETGRGRLLDVETGAGHGRIVAEAVNLARDLQNEPANILTPTELASRARQALEGHGVTVEAYDQAWMKEQGMGALLGVAQGSEEPARFIVMRYDAGDSRPPVGLVGKGITFDTGGISIKPAANMDLMKTDMSGGAAVVGAMAAIGQLKPRRNVVGIIPATENMPGGRAQRPGDVVRTFGGKTVEVINTDAEGRMVLSDALGYAVAQGCQPIVDLATLTGAMTMALGRIRTGVFSNNDETMAQFLKASETAGEKMWPMPLDDEYFDQIKSDVADMMNVGGVGAGAIIGAMVLRKMVGDTPWVHLDIAGTARSEAAKGYKPKGGTGVGVRTLVAFVEQLAE